MLLGKAACNSLPDLETGESKIGLSIFFVTKSEQSTSNCNYLSSTLIVLG